MKPPASNRGGATGLGYQPALDGLRAVSVIAVVLYHAGFGWMRGGFFGVEVFFVISGFLITSLLIDERVATGGNDLGRFWMRRARRLLPALVVVLLAVTAWTLIAGTAEQSSQLRHDMPWAVFYAANWGQILGTVPYFAHVDPPLLRHLWSLAVEEQWYLLWPFVFVALSWLGWGARRTACLLAGVALAIFAVVLLARTNDLDRVNLLYLSTPTRSSGLLLGAAFAFAWRRWRHRPDRPSPALLDAAAATALAVLVVLFVVGRVTATVTYPWTMALVSMTSAIAVVVTVHPGAVRTRRLLGSRGMAAIGRRSYGIYLWHWPVFVVVGATAGSLARFLVGLAIALALSEACYRFVEMPVRRGALSELWARRRSVAVLAGGMAASTAAVLGIALAHVSPYDVAAGGEVEQFALAIPTRGNESRSERTPTSDVVAATAATDPAPAAQPPSTSAPSSLSAATSTSTSAATSTTTSTTTTTLPTLPRSVAIVGDSQAHSLFVNLPRGIDAFFEFSDGAVNGCSVHDSGEILTARRGFHNEFGICRGWARQWADAASGSDVALVVLGAWDVFDIRDGDTVIEFGSSDYDRVFSRRLRSGLDALAFAGAHAALLEVPCMRPVDARGAAVPALPERGDDARVAHVNTLLRHAAARDPQHVTFIEGPDEWCNDEAIATDVDYRWDGVHVYQKGANLVFETIAPALLAIPIDPR